MKNKKGDVSVGVIIALVLGAIVLVLVALGLATNWNIFSSLFPTNNVQTIVNQCQTACSTGDKYSFCTQVRTLKAEDLPTADKGSKKETCNFFATTTNSDYNKYGIANCPGITC